MRGLVKAKESSSEFQFLFEVGDKMVWEGEGETEVRNGHRVKLDIIDRGDLAHTKEALVAPKGSDHTADK